MRNALRQPQDDPARITGSVKRWIVEHPECRNIAIYSALPGEIDLTPLVKLHPERRWHYPRVDGANLRFFWVHDPETELEPGNFGILEPTAALPEIELHDIDVFFCPGMAFETNGARLGRGAGFYDRMLTSSRKNACKIGVCFPCQIVPDTFSEPHDIPMQQVISE